MPAGHAFDLETVTSKSEFRLREKVVRTGLDLESRLSHGLEDGDEEGVRRSGLQRNYTKTTHDDPPNNLKEAQRAKSTAAAQRELGEHTCAW